MNKIDAGAEMVLTFRQENADGCARRFATVTLPRNKEVIADAWIEFVGEPGLPLPANLDGLVIFVLFFCMTRGGRLLVEGPMSASMLRSLRHFQQAWTRLKPKRCRFIEIVPASFADAPPADDRAIAAFSGGIDSTFLALQHTSDDLGPARYPLTDLMFVHGLDIPLEQSEAFAKAMERSREFVESTSLRLRTVRTNVRKLDIPSWEAVHGAVIGGLLHQFSHEFSLGMIASTNTYENLRLDLGSSPIVDPLLGSKSFSIVHDGAAYRRVDKVRRVAANPLATKSARVCWQGSNWSRNCGVCDKCVQTQLDFLAVGKPNPECFDGALDLRLIKKISPTSPTRLRGYEYLLEVSKDRQTEPWRVALEKRFRQLRFKRGYQAMRNGLADILGSD